MVVDVDAEFAVCHVLAIEGETVGEAVVDLCKGERISSVRRCHGLRKDSAKTSCEEENDEKDVFFIHCDYFFSIFPFS
jgi:hypothetical protein